MGMATCKSPAGQGRECRASGIRLRCDWCSQRLGTIDDGDSAESSALEHVRQSIEPEFLAEFDLFSSLPIDDLQAAVLQTLREFLAIGDGVRDMGRADLLAVLYATTDDVRERVLHHAMAHE